MDKQKTRSGVQSVSEIDILSIAGFGFHFGWYMVTVLWVIPAFVGDAPSILSACLQLSFLIGAAVVGLFLTHKGFLEFIKAWQNKHWFMLGSIIIASLPALLLLILTQTGWDLLGLDLVVFFMAGSMNAILFTYWEKIGSRLQLRNHISFVALSFCFGAAIFILFRVAFAANQGLLSIILIVCSGLLFLFIDSRQIPVPDIKHEPDFDSSLAHIRQIERRKITVMFTIISLAFGFAWAYLSLNDYLWTVVAFTIGILATILFLVITKGRKGSPQIIALQRICAATVSILLVIAAINISDLVTMSALCCILATWFMFRAINGGMLMQYALNMGFSLTSYLAAGKIGANFGVTFGWIIALVVVNFAPFMPSFSIIAAVLTFLVIIASFVLLPFGHDKKAEYADDEFDTKTQSDILADAQTLVTRCRRTSKMFGLSKREQEVLMFLVRGRNAKHIAEALFISENTAKAHINHIYAKMDIHSQHQLIDFIEGLE